MEDFQKSILATLPIQTPPGLISLTLQIKCSNSHSLTKRLSPLLNLSQLRDLKIFWGPD